MFLGGEIRYDLTFEIRKLTELRPVQKTMSRLRKTQTGPDRGSSARYPRLNVTIQGHQPAVILPLGEFQWRKVASGIINKNGARPYIVRATDWMSAALTRTHRGGRCVVSMMRL